MRYHLKEDTLGYYFIHVYERAGQISRHLKIILYSTTRKDFDFVIAIQNNASYAIKRTQVTRQFDSQIAFIINSGLQVSTF